MQLRRGKEPKLCDFCGPAETIALEETGGAAGVLGHPAMGVARLVKSSARRSEAGHLVLAGSFTRVVWAQKGDTIGVDFGELAVFGAVVWNWCAPPERRARFLPASLFGWTVAATGDTTEFLGPRRASLVARPQEYLGDLQGEQEAGSDDRCHHPIAE